MTAHIRANAHSRTGPGHDTPLQSSLRTAAQLLELSARILQKPDRYGALDLACFAAGTLRSAVERLAEELLHAETELETQPASARAYALCIAAHIAARATHDARAMLDRIGLPDAHATHEARARLDALRPTLERLTQRLHDLTPGDQHPHQHPHQHQHQHQQHHQGRA